MNTYTLQNINPRLSSNIKLVFDGSNLFFETINSNNKLSTIKYKGFKYNKNTSYVNNVQNYIKLFTDKSILFDVKEENDYISNDVNTQYDDIYSWGCYSDKSKTINENRFRFFAPLVLGDNKPSHFVIYKMKYSDMSNSTEIKDIVNKGSLVKVFDLSLFGDIWNEIERSSIDVKFSDDVITANGLDINQGVYTRKSTNFIKNLYANESTLTEFENKVTNIFRDNEILYSNMMNIEFSFDSNDISDDFCSYVGFYVNTKEIDLNKLSELKETGSMLFIQKENDVIQYSDEHVLTQYHEKVANITAVGYGLNKPPQIEMSIDFNPRIGSKLEFIYDGQIDYSMIITKDMIDPDLNQTALNIYRYIVQNIETNAISLSVEVINNTLIFTSNINNIEYENITVNKPRGFNIKNENGSNFVGSDERTIILNSRYNIDAIGYVNNNKEYVINDVEKVVYRNGDYYYKMKDVIVNKRSNPDNCFLLNVKAESILLGMCPFKHKVFDFDMSISDFANIKDYDLSDYKAYLLNTIDSRDFYGKYDINVPEEDLKAYKATLRGVINKYFDNIDNVENTLYNNVDVVTQESTVIENEYDRLNEIQNTDNNKVYPFVNKWAFGKNSFNLDNRLNINLPFRYDNYCSSPSVFDRDIKNHTHNFFVLADGLPPYLDVDEYNINKCLSYSKQQITKEMLLSKTFDAFELLEYKVFDKKESYSIIDIVNNDMCYIYHNGIKLAIQDKTLKGYKFCAMLTTRKPISDDVFSVEYVRNDTFKTLTLLCNFYIPDPILTRLERDDLFYFLDRSLLYHSNDIFSTSTTDTLDFGSDKISLKLYENTENKLFRSTPVGTNWWYRNMGGINMLDYRFNIPLNDSFKNTAEYYGKTLVNNILFKPNLENSATMHHALVNVEKENKYRISFTAKIDQECNIKIKSNNVIDQNGNKITNLIDVSNLNTDIWYTFVIYIGDNYEAYIYDDDDNIVYRSNREFYFQNSVPVSLLFEVNKEPSLRDVTFDCINIQFQKMDGTEQDIDDILMCVEPSYNSDLDQHRIFIERGLSNIFSSDIRDLLELNSNFKIKYENNNTAYDIEFINILDVEKSYFWCEDIKISTHDTNVSKSVISEFFQNPNIFDIDNVLYTSRSIALNNSSYDKIVNRKANLARYKEVSTANIMRYITDNDILCTNENNVSKNVNSNVVLPTEKTAVISLTKDVEGNIIKNDNAFLFPLLRYDGEYKPITKTINENDGIYHNYITTLKNVNAYRKIVGKKQYPYFYELYSTNYCHSFFDNMFSVDGVLFDWGVNQIERKGYQSIVLDTSSTLEFIINIDSNVVDFLDVFKDSRYIKDFDYNSLAVSKIFGVTQTEQNINEQNVIDYIKMNFIRNTLLSIYNIKACYINDEKISFSTTYDGIVLDRSIDELTVLKIELER